MVSECVRESESKSVTAALRNSILGRADRAMLRGTSALTPPPPREIVLILLDDVPRNLLTPYGARHGLSPHLDSIAREGVTFENSFTTSPLCTEA